MGRGTASRSVWKGPADGRPIGWAVLAAGWLALAGCGGGPRGVEVAGEVLFDGKPLPAGRIYFNPDFAKGNDGPQGHAVIQNGKFDTRKGGRPATAGPTIAVIQGYDGDQTDVPGSMGNPLFREYQTAVELPRETCTQNFEVPASAAEDAPKAPRSGRRP
jgi:hypothetical protein